MLGGTGSCVCMFPMRAVSMYMYIHGNITGLGVLCCFTLILNFVCFFHLSLTLMLMRDEKGRINYDIKY